MELASRFTFAYVSLKVALRAVLQDDIYAQVNIYERVNIAHHIGRIEVTKEINLLQHSAGYLLWVLLGLNYFNHILLIFQKFADLVLLLGSSARSSSHSRRIAATEEGTSILFSCV